MSIAVDNLTSLANVRTMLGIPDTSETALINLLIPQVSAAIAERLGRPVLLLSNPSQPLARYYSGRGTNWLLLRDRPVYTPILAGNTTAGSAVVTLPSTQYLFLNQPVTGTTLPTAPSGSANVSIQLFGRQITDGVLTRNSQTLTSATANFTGTDVGSPISGTGIPTSTKITGIMDANNVTMSQNATATATGVTVTIANPTQVTLTQPAATTGTSVPLFFGLNVWLDSAGYWGQPPVSFLPTSQLTWGSDYTIRADQPDGSSRSGMLLRQNDVWPTQFSRAGDMLSNMIATGFGNVQVQSMAGWPTVPPDLEMFAIRVIARLRASRLYGSAVTSESFENYSRSLANGEAKAQLNLGILTEDGAILAKYANSGLGE